MRLFELIQTKTTQKDVDASFDMHNRGKLAANYGVKDGEDPWNSDNGTYAHGKENPRDPHQFRKKNYLPAELENDAYYQYIKAAEPYMGENPYFPRVYNITIKTDNNGRELPSYDIEKLHKANDLPVETLISIGKNIFNRFDVQDKPEDLFPSQIAATLAHKIETALMSNNMSNIKDDNLINACYIIMDVRDSNEHFDYDFGPKNIMFRGTPHGPQLVITDPLFDNEHSIVRR